MRIIIAAVLVPAVLCCFAGCGGLGGLVGTRIVVRTRRQSLREQVLGTYGELEEEVYLLAGVRSVDPLTGQPKPPPKMTPSQRRALDARRSMEFNRDDLLLFKRLGYVGEGRGGLPVFFPEQQEELKAESPWLFRLVSEIVAEEQQDRERILERIVETTPELHGEDGLRQVKAILAENYRLEAEPGMRVQLPDGTWVTKRAEGSAGD